MAADPTEASPPAVARAAAELASRDPDLARLLEAHGPPPAWHRGPGFRTLVHTVLGQQVSLASARAALDRLETAAGGAEPADIVAVGRAGSGPRGSRARRRATWWVWRTTRWPAVWTSTRSGAARTRR
ncbi:MAG: hypothetical protein R3C32_11870 [Chloroflexota bacterium]